jgi:hypothetical protein
MLPSKVSDFVSISISRTSSEDAWKMSIKKWRSTCAIPAAQFLWTRKSALEFLRSTMCHVGSFKMLPTKKGLASHFLSAFRDREFHRILHTCAQSRTNFFFLLSTKTSIKKNTTSSDRGKAIENRYAFSTCDEKKKKKIFFLLRCSSGAFEIFCFVVIFRYTWMALRYFCKERREAQKKKTIKKTQKRRRRKKERLSGSEWVLCFHPVSSSTLRFLFFSFRLTSRMSLRRHY